MEVPVSSGAVGGGGTIYITCLLSMPEHLIDSTELKVDIFYCPWTIIISCEEIRVFLPFYCPWTIIISCEEIRVFLPFLELFKCVRGKAISATPMVTIIKQRAGPE